jgi:2-keto-4-pentenoate hydratase/2-oxohepta-3-ene-1,7-dioic acid hydratase in catechol pathway
VSKSVNSERTAVSRDWMEPREVVDIEVEGVGVLRNRVVQGGRQP